MTGRACPHFVVSAENYDRMMGRYLPTLAPVFADAAGVTAGQRVLDVGCGPGGLTTELVRRIGADSVTAVDPSPPFVEACRQRNPGVDVREANAEELPLAENVVDAALASLVVGFMTDPVVGLREMTRVTVPGGTVAACFWDRERMPSIQTFWQAAAALDPAVGGEGARIGARRGDLENLLARTGLTDVSGGEITATSRYRDIDELWASYTIGVGPIGAYYRTLDDDQRAALRAEHRRLFAAPDAPVQLEATAWFALGTP